MLPSDLNLARLCADSYAATSSFDFIDEGKETGVWVAVRKLADVDVVVFRGSDSVEDWLRDFDAEMIDVTGLGRVHAGFYKNMQDVWLKLNQVIRRNPIVTGHSLGAARAAIYSALLIYPPQKTALFGCPRPAAQGLADALKLIPINSYKNRADPVMDVPVVLPDFPYVHVREMIHVDGSMSNEFPDLLKDHHIQCYINGLETLK